MVELDWCWERWQAEIGSQSCESCVGDRLQRHDWELNNGAAPKSRLGDRQAANGAGPRRADRQAGGENRSGWNGPG
jgi:hypothetical protein